MKVRLSHAQWNSIRERIPTDVAEFMAEHRVAVGKSHDYSMPAIGWKRALDELVNTMYGPLGGKMESATPYRAIGLIARAVSNMETHPAFTPGLAVMGVRSEVIPAWLRFDLGILPELSPYPGKTGLGVDQTGEFQLRFPELIVRSGHELTIWKQELPGQAQPADVSLEPASHILLRGGVEAPR